MTQPTVLPNGWTSTTLGAVAEILDRFRVPVNAEERAKRGGSIPYFGATAQVGWIDDYLFDEELLLLGEDGAPFLDHQRAKAYLIRGKSWVNNHAHVLRGSDGVLNGFLMHQLNQVDYMPFVSGTTRLKLPQATMLQIPLLLPPTAEQKRIVAAIEEQFTRLDAAVVSLEHARTNLKRYRDAILGAAIHGRLVPTEAAMARTERRTFESGEQLLMRVTGKLWTGNPADGSGELPDGWAWTSLAEIADLKGGITKGQRRRTDDTVRPVPYLRVANVQRGYLDLHEVKSIEATENEIAELRLLARDVLFNEGGDRDKLGRGWIWRGEIPECIHQNHVFRARLRSHEIEPKYISWYSNSAGQQYFMSEGKQTTNLASINLTKLGLLPIPLPPIMEQQRIVAELERRLSGVEEAELAIEANLRRGERLRHAIMKRAFEGRLVPQDPEAEPAAALLRRIRERRTVPPPSPSRRARMLRSDRRGQGRRPLIEVLRENKNASGMTPEDLLYQSGHTRDSIDDFYAELKGEESAGRLTVHHPDDTDLRITLAAG